MSCSLCKGAGKVREPIFGGPTLPYEPERLRNVDPGDLEHRTIPCPCCAGASGMAKAPVPAPVVRCPGCGREISVNVPADV